MTNYHIFVQHTEKIRFSLPFRNTFSAHHRASGAVMPHHITPGDIVKYRGTACYTGNPYTLHALVISVDKDFLQVLPLSPSKDQFEFDAVRELRAEGCQIIDHVDLPDDAQIDTIAFSFFSSKDREALLHWSQQ